MTNHQETFTTTDTPLAAYLITEGFTLLDMVFEGKVAKFIFPNDSDSLTQSIKDFGLMRATSNAYMLIQNYQALVKRIYRGF